MDTKEMIKKDFKQSVITAIVLFFVSVIIGMFYPEDTVDKLLTLVIKYLQNVQFTTFGIFRNNITSSFVMSFVGGLMLGIPTVFLGFFNFSLLSVIFIAKGEELGILTFFMSIVPHGIFEIPAIILSISVGLMIAKNLWGRLLGFEVAPFKELMFECLLIFIRIIFPLLVVAAVVETFVTPSLLSFFKLI